MSRAAGSPALKVTFEISYRPDRGWRWVAKNCRGSAWGGSVAYSRKETCREALECFIDNIQARSFTIIDGKVKR